MLTGNKLDGKIYYDHSRYVGGLRERTGREMKEKYPVEMLERAVKGMLPHNRLGRAMGKKLFVYSGPDHKHEAQQPKTLEIKQEELWLRNKNGQLLVEEKEVQQE